MSQITFDLGQNWIDSYGPERLREVESMTANRDQHYWHAATPPEWQNFDSSYELVTVCLWSVVAVSLASLLMWLALGGPL